MTSRNFSKEKYLLRQSKSNGVLLRFLTYCDNPVNGESSVLLEIKSSQHFCFTVFIMKNAPKAPIGGTLAKIQHKIFPE